MNQQRKSRRLAPCLAFIVLAPGAPMAAVAESDAAALAEASALGRLFYTPQQRTRLERLGNQPAEAAATIGHTILVNGIVQHSSGRRVIWINGTPRREEDAGGLLAARSLPPDAATVQVPSAATPIRLKVGESFRIGESIRPDGAAAARLTQPDAAGQTVPAGKPGQRPAANAGRADAPR